MRIHERMTKIQLMGYTIRVWENVPNLPWDKLPMGPNHEFTVGVRAAVRPLEEGIVRLTPEGIGAALETLPNVAAYEIVDAMGNGCVVYVDWP